MMADISVVCTDEVVRFYKQ